MRIGINCGHTKNGPGCGAVGYLNESNETRNVGYKIMEYLRQAGHEVFDCTNDVASSVVANLNNICVIANAQRLDLFLSVHFNAGGGRGCECYTYKGAKHSEGERINKKLKDLGFLNRGIKDGSNLYVVKNAKAKAILVEVCFVDNAADADLYQSLGADVVAKAMAEGICGTEIAAPAPAKALETVNDIVWELSHRGIVSDKELWLEKLEREEDVYHLARKCVNYIRGTEV